MRRILIGAVVCLVIAAAIPVFQVILRDLGLAPQLNKNPKLMIAREINNLYPSLETIVDLTESEIDLAKALVSISVIASQDFSGKEVDSAEVLRQINKMRFDAAQIDFKKLSAEEMRLSLLRLFNHDYSIGIPTTLAAGYRPSAILINEILENKAGNCMGLSALYMAVLDGQIPLHGVFAMNHVLVRYDDGRRQINIDPTLNQPDANVSNATYMELFTISPQSEFLMRNLTKKEFVSMYLTAIASGFGDSGRKASAIRLLGYARKAAPTNPMAFFIVGELTLLAGKNDEAEAYLTSGLKLDPANDRAWINLGIVYFNSDRFPQAIASHQKAIQINPNNEKAYLNLGLAHFGSGDRQAARAALLDALRLNPDSAANQMLKELNAKA